MNTELILGWIALILATLITCFWAYWGINENFHEGWYYRSLIKNLLMMFVQYLSFMLVAMGITLVSIRWPRVGGAVFMAVGLAFSAWIFGTRRTINARVILSWLPVTVPLVLIGVLFWFGRPRPLKLACAAAVIPPLLVVLAFAIEPVIRIAGRLDDGNRKARRVAGSGVELIWAPAGPGWPDRGVSWEEAKRRCRFLAEDGRAIADTPQDVWRLPTVEEAVRSLTRGAKNCGGQWDSNVGAASYSIKPDKESPLWDPHSPVIYWWTSTTNKSGRPYMIVYHGQVFPRSRNTRMGSLAFRAVKNWHGE